MNKIIKEMYFHIKGAPRLEELPLGSTKQNYMKAKVYYDLGGTNLFSYRNDPRGYYFYITPIGRGKDSCGFWEAHSLVGSRKGDCRFLIECNRQSKAKEKQALEWFDKNVMSVIKEQYPELEIEEGVV